MNTEKIISIKERLEVLKSYKEQKKFDAILGVRPEDIISQKASKIIEHASDIFPLFINQAELLGNEYYIYSTLDEKKIVAKISANEEVNAKEEQQFAINLDNIHLFDKNSEKRYF